MSSLCRLLSITFLLANDEKEIMIIKTWFYFVKSIGSITDQRANLYYAEIGITSRVIGTI